MPKKHPEQRFYLGKTTVLESANQGPLVGRPFRVTRREMALFGHADWEGRLVKAGGRLPKGWPQRRPTQRFSRSARCVAAEPVVLQ